MITSEVSDLRFSSKMRGGYAVCEAPLKRPLALPGVEEFSQLTVFDNRSGAVVWDGRVVTPGRGVSTSGQVAELSAIGEGPSSTKDTKRPYMVLDSDLSSWEEQTSSTKDLSVRTGPSPNSDLPGLTFTARGTVTTGDQSIAWHRNLYLCGQLIGAISFAHIEGENGTHALDLRIGETP